MKQQQGNPSQSAARFRPPPIPILSTRRAGNDQVAGFHRLIPTSTVLVLVLVLMPTLPSQTKKHGRPGEARFGTFA